MNRYVVDSLELHLFFGRIMKEHAFFLRAGFTPAAPDCGDKAGFYRCEFENILRQAVALSSGVVGGEVLASGEVVTRFTSLAEKQTQCLTGIHIDCSITESELRLKCADQQRGISGELLRKVRQLNRKVLRLLDGLIAFKEGILNKVLQGELFTVNYPLLIEHITREAKLYRRFVEVLEREGMLPRRLSRETECFWNQIMMEHAQFIRGLLDPCEEELFNTADDFAEQYCVLLAASRDAQGRTMTKKALEQTVKFRDFKAAGTEGIQQCKIRSIILPLLADHVLREANHYIRLLEDQ